MNGETFLQDLAVVMMVAGVVTLLFHRLKQPVVLGYLLAGFIIGPFTPPFPLVKDAHTIETMANMGVIFLMFSLGLDFNLRKLHRVGLATLLMATVEITALMISGYLLGALFGWGRADSFFLGVMIALTSTMIVVKSLKDAKEMHSSHAELISGTCLFEDIFMILVMVIMPGFARTGSVPTAEVMLMLAGLFVFLVAAVILGLLAVPRLLRYIARHATAETMLIVSLGLLFGLAMFAEKLHFSAALGAFLIGAIVAESRDAARVTVLTEPIRDMFCAVFFVAIGMQIDPAQLPGSILPALIITVVFIVVKTAACAFGAFVTGADGKTAMRVGTNMVQVGEFAFVLATLATQLRLADDFLYAVIVTVAAMNALIRPYLVENADAMTVRLMGLLPTRVVVLATNFRRRVARLWSRSPRQSAMKHVRSLAFQLALNMALIAGGFIIAAYVHQVFPDLFSFVPGFAKGTEGLYWLAAAVLLLPLYIATFRKMQAMAMMVSELMTPGASTGGRTGRTVRTTLSGLLFAIQLIVLVGITLLVSAAILPPWQTLIISLAIIAALIFLHGRSFNRWYTEAKFALISTFDIPIPEPAPPDQRPMPPQLSEARIESVAITPGTHEGRLIRELELRSRTGASIVAIERDGRSVVNPGPDMELLAGDVLLLLGDNEQVASARRLVEGGSVPG